MPSGICLWCGTPLLDAKRKLCETCQKTKAARRVAGEIKPTNPPEYTISDRVAQARAYDLSYGKFMAIIETGGKLPPLKRPIKWPEGSAHVGE